MPSIPAELSPQVLEDLTTLYLSGEASQDTRSLVETYLEANPEAAERLAKSRELKLPELDLGGEGQDREVVVLRRTRRWLRLQAWFFGLAIFFTAMLFTFGSFDERGLHWIILSTDWWPLFAGCGAVSWLGWLLVRRRLG